MLFTDPARIREDFATILTFLSIGGQEEVFALVFRRLVQMNPDDRAASENLFWGLVVEWDHANLCKAASCAVGTPYHARLQQLANAAKKPTAPS